MRVESYQSMPIRPQVRDVLIRIGAPRTQDAALIEKAKQTIAPLRPYGLLTLIPIDVQAQQVDFQGRVMRSEKLARYLQGCSHALLMVSTLKQPVCDRIHQLMENGQSDEGIWLDAAASVAADTGLDFMIAAQQKKLEKQGMRTLSWRYSPGYGDLPLENQQILYDYLGAQSLGIRLTSSYMRLPEKSVMAICGVQTCR